MRATAPSGGATSLRAHRVRGACQVLNAAGGKPEPGSTRKVTARDLNKLSKIFGPSRYPAYNADDPPAPPGLDVNGRTPAGPAAPLRGFGTASTAGSSASKGAMGSAAALAAIESAQAWLDLQPVLRRAVLGPAGLVALSDQLGKLVMYKGIADAAEMEALRGFCGELAMASQLQVALFSMHQLSVLLRTFLTLSCVPDSSWLFGAESAALDLMQGMLEGAEARAQEQQQQGREGALSLLDVQQAEDLITLTSAFLAIQYTPRESFIEAFGSVSDLLLAQLAEDAAEVGEARTRAAGLMHPGGRKGGLIQMPEQKEADEVVMADGRRVDVTAAPSLSPSTASEPGPRRIALDAAATAAIDDVLNGRSKLTLSPAAWVGLVTVIPTWELPISEDWLQRFLQASYGALQDSALILTAGQARGDVGPGELQGSQNALDIITGTFNLNTVADVAALPLRVGVRPDESWGSAVMAAASAAMAMAPTQPLPPGVSSPQELFEVRADALAMLLQVLKELGVKPDAQFLSEGMAAAARSQRRLPGDAIASLIQQVSSLERELDDSAIAAGVALAAQAEQLWKEGLAAEAEQARKAKSKLAAQAAGGRAAAAAAAEQTEEQEAEDVYGGFTPPGLIALFVGLADMGSAAQLPPKWMQAWGEQVMRRVQELDVNLAVLALVCAAKNGVPLGPRAAVTLLGKVLQEVSPKPPPGAEPSPPKPSPVLRVEQLSEVFTALLLQPQQLPVTWLPQMQSLITAYLPEMAPTDIPNALRVIGMLPVRPDPSFVQSLLSHFDALNGLITPDGCVAMAQALGSVGADEAELRVVDAAAVGAMSDGRARPDAWVDLLVGFAQAAYVPSPEWWTAMVRATSDHSVLRPRDVANLLGAFGMLRALRGDAANTLAAGWLPSLLAHVEAQLSDGPTAEEMKYYLGGVGALMQPHSATLCLAAERAGLQLAASQQLEPAVIAGCLVVFVGSKHEVSKEWLAAAVGAFERQLEEAAGQDLVAFMASITAIKGLKEQVGPPLMTKVVEEAAKAAVTGRMDPSQITAFCLAAADAGCSATTAPTAMSGLVERAGSMRELFTAQEVVELLTALQRMRIRPGPRWIDAMLKVVAETESLVQAGTPDTLSKLLVVLDAWTLQVPQPLQATLGAAIPPLATAAAAAATATASPAVDSPTGSSAVSTSLPAEAALQALQFLANLDRPRGVPMMAEPLAQDTVNALTALLRTGSLNPTQHASLLYSVAKLAGSLQRSSSGAISVGQPERDTAVAAPQLPLVAELLPVAVEVTGRALVRYSPEELVTVFSSLASLRAVLPPTWLELYWEYSQPLLRTLPADVLGGALSAVGAAGVRPPASWEARLMETLDTRAAGFSMQELEVVLASLGTTGLRPPVHVLQALLDSALSGAQKAAADAEAAAQPSEGAAAPAAEADRQQAGGLDAPSTRAAAGRRRVAPVGRGASKSLTQAASASGAGEDTPAAVALKATADRQAAALLRTLCRVARAFDYQPAKNWFEACRLVITPVLSSRAVSDADRALVSELLKAVDS